MADDTLQTQQLEDLAKQSIQARARPSPWDSSSSPGIGPGFGDTWFGGNLIVNTAQVADEIISWSYYPMRRDRQLRAFWKSEGILSGAVYSFAARISALPALIDGPPRNKVKAQKLLYGLDTQKLVIDLLTMDNGFFIERVGPGRPDKPLNPRLIQQLAVIDSQQCWRTFDPDFPVIYINPYTGQYHKLHYTRVITGSSCPQPDELARGIGFCAISRVLRYSQIMRDISIYKHEKVGGRFTRAIGTVSGITEEQFKKTMNAAKIQADQMGLTRFNGIPFLVHPMTQLKVEITDLARLPDGFNAKDDVDMYVNALALAFGTDVREFWPGQGSGATKADATVQHEKARGKGIADVISQIERSMNWGVLDALNCDVHYDYTDDAEQMADAQYAYQVITNVSAMQTAGNITAPQGTAILIEKKIIDPDVIASVADAEQAEPANTDEPFDQDITPVQEPKNTPVQQQGGAPPPKPPAPPGATSPLPPGGIKPPPPVLQKPASPLMNTQNMRPSKKEFRAPDWMFKAYDESKHTRDAHGKFTSGGGGTADASKKGVGEFKPNKADCESSGDCGKRNFKDYGKVGLFEKREQLDKLAGDHRNSLSPAEQEAVLAYSFQGDRRVNGLLRNGEVAPEDRANVEAEVNRLDSVMSKTEVPEDTLVYRGLTDMPAGLAEGQDFTEKGYMSTTVSPNVAKQFAQQKSENGPRIPGKQPAIVKIKVPKGVNGIHMQQMSHYPTENELLLHRNATIHIDKIEPGNGFRKPAVVHAHYVTG